MRDAIQAMAWANPARVAGMEATLLALKSIDVGDRAEDANDVILRSWANSAVAAVHHVKQIKKNSLPKLIKEEVTGLIRGDSWWARERLTSIRNAQEVNRLEAKRQGRKRADRIASMLLDMTHLKFTLEDIPNFDLPRWRPLVYKGTELTAVDFGKIKGPLLKAVKIQRDARLNQLLRNFVPPTPSSVSNPGYHGPEDITGIVVAGLPAKIFLEICMNLDLATLSAVEKTCRDVRLLLQSTHADRIWRRIRLSVGLMVRFQDWSERAFLAFAMSRTCDRCGHMEGLHIPRIAYIICGDCFEMELFNANAHNYKPIKPLVNSMVKLSAGSYVDAGWVRYVKGCNKLMKASYADAMLHWVCHLPKAVKKAVPDETLAKHVETTTRSFLDIANQCETWRSARDPGCLFLVQRREAWYGLAPFDLSVLSVDDALFGIAS
ncbi:hypothetical protein FS837_003807 [Tulasnella sp. UAMH 9824]|nr:hypothetical protein FS837_003807 [Tulasnella sp. UAMH 9824]